MSTYKEQYCGKLERVFIDLDISSRKSTIIFKSELLSELFINKLKADFHVNESHIYHLATTKRNQKCQLLVNSIKMSVEISNIGHKVWVRDFMENTLPHLTAQLVENTNQENKQSSASNVKPFKSQNTDEQFATVTAELKKLREQINIVRTVTKTVDLDSAIPTTGACKRVTSTKDVCSTSGAWSVASGNSSPPNASNTASGSGTTISTHSQTSTSKAGSTSSSSSSSSSRAGTRATIGLPDASRKNKASVANIHSQTARTQHIKTITKNTLLLGSSILNKANPKGLKANVHKHAIPGATIKTLMSEVKLFNLNIFTSVVIYIGGNDVANGTDVELIEEQYDQLIQQLRRENPSVNIYISKIAPRGDTDVSQINNIVERLATHYKLEVVDIFSAFHDKRGFVCIRYLDHDSIHPTVSGLKRILGTIDKAVSIVHSFDNCVYMQKHHAYPRYRSNATLKNVNCKACFKCGEHNHDTRECRHRSPVSCWGCGFSGHKQQRCWNFV